MLSFVHTYLIDDAPDAVIVALWRGRLPLVSCVTVTIGFETSTLILVLPPEKFWFVPDWLHISLMLPILLIPCTFNALLLSRLTADDTVPVKYKTFVSAPPAYERVPTLVEIVRLLFNELFCLSTISLNTRATVIVSPGRYVPPAIGATPRSTGSLSSLTTA